MASVFENYYLLQEMHEEHFFDDYHAFDVRVSLPLLEGVVNVLQPLASHLDAVGPESTVSISMVVPLVKLMWDACAPAEEALPPGSVACSMNRFHLALREEIKLRFILPYMRYPGPVLFGPMLDPRIGPVVLVDLLENMLPVGCPTTAVGVLENCMMLLADHACGLANNEEVTTEVARSALDFAMTVVRRVHLPMNTNILEWWMSRSSMFQPYVSTLARGYLAVPAASTSSERVFSTAGLICSSKRPKLKPDTLEDLLLISKNSHHVIDMKPDRFKNTFT
jgi:hypothetical protein